MTHQIIDNYRGKVIGEFDSLAGAEKAFSRLSPEENRYEITSPKPTKARKPKAKKADVKSEGE
jgi:hypothetical protein|tara:strand:- start:527 stop:715 length:189 start_codon:yes stop_codon:yes gene_type:complete